MSGDGYKDDFLEPGERDFRVPLPEFDDDLLEELFQDGTPARPRWFHHTHFSVLVNRRLRTTAVAAMNVDKCRVIKSLEDASWSEQEGLDPELQLGKTYYAPRGDFSNDFDLGHLAPKASIGWGDDEPAAQAAADSTFVFTNATLQHANLNRDEWRLLEEWVREKSDEAGSRLCVFVGPIYGLINLSVRPLRLDPGIAPSGYFKIIAFRNAASPHNLSVRAFIIQQGVETIRDRTGWRPKMLQAYQVSLTQIERLTGLFFDQRLKELNPMFHDPGAGADAVGVRGFPEMKLVSIDQDIVDLNERRSGLATETSKIFIAAGLFNPSTHRDRGEWISLINLGSSDAKLDVWVLRNQRGQTMPLSGPITPGETIKISLEGMNIPNEKGPVTLLGPREDGQTLVPVDEVWLNSKEIETQDMVLPFLAKRFS